MHYGNVTSTDVKTTIGRQTIKNPPNVYEFFFYL